MESVTLQVHRLNRALNCGWKWWRHQHWVAEWFYSLHSYVPLYPEAYMEIMYIDTYSVYIMCIYFMYIHCVLLFMLERVSSKHPRSRQQLSRFEFVFYVTTWGCCQSSVLLDSLCTCLITNWYSICFKLFSNVYKEIFLFIFIKHFEYWKATCIYFCKYILMCCALSHTL